MKELSIEQKAKLYDEAKLRMSAAYNSNRCTIGFMNEIFPELKENGDSEDEKIRKSIIEFVKQNKSFHYLLGVSKEDALAWLEKKGEQKLDGTFVNVDDVREDFVQEVYRVLDADSTNDRANQIIDAFDNLPTVTIEKQGEQKPINIVTILNDYFAKTPKEQQDKDWEELKHLNNFGWELVEQKPAWSEEDEKSLLELSQCCDLNKTQVQWLLSLKDRVQPKQEWSEEDEYCRHQLIVFCENCMVKDDGAKRCAHWLKSLRPQNTWKPSDEQMDILWDAIVYVEGCNSNFKGGGSVLENLYSDLKKLRGE